jgi:hypothetical protein
MPRPPAVAIHNDSYVIRDFEVWIWDFGFVLGFGF